MQSISQVDHNRELDRERVDEYNDRLDADYDA